MTAPLIRRIGIAEARPFILAHHYSKTVPTGDNIFFGCDLDDELYAVVNYGRIASRTKPSIVLGRPDADAKNTLELRRLCRIGAKGAARLNTSDILRACHAELAFLGYRYVLSYSDRAYNQFEVQFKRVKHKSGGVYKHAGFEWIGPTSAEWHVEDAAGNRFHRSRAYRRMLSHNIALCGGDENIPRKSSGNEDRIWPDLPKATKDDAPYPPNKLWNIDLVRDWMGFRRLECPPKDKWLLDLDP